jgi:1-acyl-sn-glycerol-3-phosphate acyltransferase
MKRWYLNITFYSLFLLFSLIGIPLLAVFVACLAPFLGHRRTMRRFRRAITWYGRTIITLFAFPLVRVQYRDLEKEMRTGPVLLVCNHRSTTDPFLASCLPFEIVQIVKKWPFKIPVLGPLARFAGYLNIEEMSIEEFCDVGERFFREGVSLIAFPEGTRSGSREMGSFGGAVFRLALRTKVPIVPLCVVGNEIVLKKGSLVLNPGRILMRKLPALRWADYKDKTSFQLKETVRKIIAEKAMEMDKEHDELVSPMRRQ